MLPDAQPPTFTIRLLGPAEIRVLGQSLPALRSRSGLWLLALLVLRHPRPVERDWLAGTLWPESDPEQGLANLRQRLAELRRVLGEEGRRRLLTPSGRTLALDLEGAEVDLIDFDAALQQGDTTSLEQAVALYRGELLEGCSEEWALQERQAREAGTLGALERLAEAACTDGEPAVAVGYLRRVVMADPMRESAQRALMSALAADGNYAEAVQVYREVRLRLSEQLHTDPDAATTTLFERLRREARERAIAGRRDRGSVTSSVSSPERGASSASQSLQVSPLSSLGSGVHTTLTLLFTDIEGSTQLWEKHPQVMRSALLRHDELLREVIETHGGEVFKTMGDAFCAVFSSTPEALEAAVEAQQALTSEVWPAEAVLKVRMALHTGTVERRDDDYFGQAVNRVARLLSAGHGGQILLSRTTYDLTSDHLPEFASLSDLGEHRLRDLQRPEQVFQLHHPQLPAHFPPLRSLDNPDLPNNLPRQLTSFIGREKEMAEVKALLHKTSLLTLTGSGGCGKTRLALQVAAEVLEEYRDGVWLVELAPLSDAGLLPQTVAQALTIREVPGEPILKTMLSVLKAKQMLLVLDNCEHLLDASAHLADAVVRGCTKVRVMASSREGLGISGETTYRVPSLSLPDPREPQTSESLSRYESARLFIERATQTQTSFRVTDQNAPALSSICLRLDGIPLALELAATRVRSLSVEEINSRLHQRFRLLTGGSRTALPRQQTLRAMIDWSYDLLDEQQRSVLCRLSVFAGGWSVEAAEEVCAGGGIEEWEVLELLTSLVDKSLAVYEERGGQARYRLLETVRQYARDRLVESGESEAFRERHRDYFLAIAEEADPKVWGLEQAEWLQRLEEEHENLRAALEWCLEEEAGIEVGLRLAGSLWGFWDTRGHLAEGRAHLQRALERDGAQEPTRARASALNAAGILAYLQGDGVQRTHLHSEALTIYQQLGDKGGQAWSLHGLAGTLADSTQAQALYVEAMTLAREAGEKDMTITLPMCLSNLGSIALGRQDYAAARALYAETLAISRESGILTGIALALGNLGNVALLQGDYAAAHRYSEEAVAMNRGTGHRRLVAGSLCNLAWSVLMQGDYASVRPYLEESLTLYRELGNRHGMARHGTAIADLLAAFANLAANTGRMMQASALWGASEAQREEIGWSLSPGERGLFERYVPEARLALGEMAFSAEWARGRSMTMEEAIEETGS